LRDCPSTTRLRRAVPLPEASSGRIEGPKILPELASGRGTARRSRVVEGQAGSGVCDDRLGSSLCIRQNLAGRDPQRLDPMARCPRIPLDIVTKLVGMVVELAVDLDRQARIAAIEVEHVVARFVLTAKFEAVGALAKQPPQ